MTQLKYFINEIKFSNLAHFFSPVLFSKFIESNTRTGEG